MNDQTKTVIRSVIAGCGSALPQRVMTNADMSKIVDTSDEWIVERSGIRQRYIAGDGETTSSLATDAARAALAAAGLEGHQIGLIVLAVVAAGFARHAAGGPHASVRPGRILHESLTDGTQMLLLGSMLIGYVSGDPGKAILQPVFLDLFRCILALFLLDMGLLVARNLGKLSLDQKPALVYALVAPFVHAALALLCCRALGLHAGDGALLMTLAASASFIAVPAVLRQAVPEANPTLYFGLALAVNFPLNLIFGIPLWIELARRYLAP